LNRFNLTFSGEILAGEQPDQVKLRFGELLAIDDPVRLERFFSGETIILRRNLERKEAAQCFQDMRRIGVVTQLVKVTASEAADAVVGHAADGGQTWAAGPGTRPKSGTRKSGTRRRENAAREKAEREKAAREKAEREKAAREEAEREKAEREKAAREEAEREKAEREQAAREKAAREKAERDKAARETAERQRREAENAAARKDWQRTIEEARARIAAAEEVAAQARSRAQQEQQRRRLAEEAARQRILDEERRRRAEQAEAREQQRRAAQQAAAEKTRQRQAGAATRPSSSAAGAGDAGALALEERAIERAAQELSKGATLKAATPRVKTRLELPARRSQGAGEQAVPAARKRRGGEPNFFALRPFRNTPAVQQRAARAGRSLRRALGGALLAAVALASLGVLQQRIPQPLPVSGADALAAAPDGKLALLAGDRLLLHDRAGVGENEQTLASLGLSSLQAPVVFAGDDELLGLGAVADTPDDGPQLLRCSLEQGSCLPLAALLAGSAIATYRPHPLDGSFFVATREPAQLLQLDPGGEVLARAAIALPPRPVLRQHAGLLFMNSAQGPGISVFRYDRNAFGEQLDEVLLLPPDAIDAGHERVGDFLWNGSAWWVVMYAPDSGDAGLYRFDSQWNYLGRAPLDAAEPDLQLVAWGGKTLANSGHGAGIARFGEQGNAEAPFVSGLLEELIAQGRRRAQVAALAWRGGYLLTGLSALLCGALAYLFYLRSLVYRPRRERDAEPADDHLDDLHWIAALPARRAALRRRGASYAAFSLATCLLAISQGVNAYQLAALLLALSGPAAALLLVARQPVGSIGVAGDRLLLVDHRGIYHFGGGSLIAYRGAFLLMDDVVVFIGNRLFPAFPRDALRRHVAPLARAGIRVDRKTVAVKLLQGRHPFALGALLTLLGVVAAALLLTAQAVF